MKNIIFIVTLLFIASFSFAQNNLTLVMSNTPTAVLNSWANKREVLTLLINGQPNGKEVKIKTEIKTTDGTVIGTTDLSKAKTYLFNLATTVLTANDVIPLENMIFTGKYKKSLEKTGKLPADNYSICVQLVSLPLFDIASNQQCKFFYVAGLQLPILVSPSKEEKLDAIAAQTAIIFRWTPVAPAQSELPTYRIQVFEIIENQTPMQALRSNQPLLDKEILAATQFIWRPQLGLLRPMDADSASYQQNANLNGKRNAAAFIWTIQTLDRQGNPIVQVNGNGEARSEPTQFYIIPNSTQTKRKEKIAE